MAAPEFKKVRITYPVFQRWRPRQSYDDVLSFMVFRSPREFWWSGRWYTREDFVPGAIIDSTGLEVPIIDYPGTERPKWAIVAEITLGLLWMLQLARGFRHRYEFGPPQQLSLDEVKSRAIKCLKEEVTSRIGPLPIQQVKAATSVGGVFEALYDEKLVRSPPIEEDIIVTVSPSAV